MSLKRSIPQPTTSPAQEAKTPAAAENVVRTAASAATEPKIGLPVGAEMAQVVDLAEFSPNLRGTAAATASGAPGVKEYGQDGPPIYERDTEPTRTVFRVWKDTGDVMALFPDVPENRGLCSSYMHVGQHGAADYNGCIERTRPASPEEYVDLKAELEAIGYLVDVRQRR